MANADLQAEAVSHKPLAISLTRVNTSNMTLRLAVYAGVTGEAVAVPVSGVPAEVQADDSAVRLAALFDAQS
jgi:hypothetical protein